MFYTLCMEIKSVSSVILFVSDISVSKSFYTSLGFRSQDDDSPRVYLNWFSIEFRVVTENAETAGSGMRVGIKVDDVTSVHDAAVGSSYKVVEPVHYVSKNVREFVIADPDGYLLAFYGK